MMFIRTMSTRSVRKNLAESVRQLQAANLIALADAAYVGSKERKVLLQEAARLAGVSGIEKALR